MRMRILILESSGNLWGSERALLDLIDGLAEENLELAVCCPPKRPLQPELEKRGLRVYPSFVYALHEKSKAARLRATLGLLLSCLRFRPDLIYLNQAGAARIASLVSRVLRVPIVAHVRIFEDAAYLARLRPSPQWLRGLVAISAAMEAELRSYPALERIAVHTLYDAYRISSGDGSAAMEATDEHRRRRIACVGRLAPIKGQDLLVEALGILRVEGVEVACAFAGSGDEDFAESLRQLARDKDVDSAVEWLGYTDAVLPLLQSSSVLVCPSHREPLGRVIFEAWDAGCLPVVFAGSGGAAEVVDASGGGLLYEAQDADSLAKAIREALAMDPAERRSRVERGREWMRAHLSPGRYGAAMKSVFAEAVEQSP